MVAVEVAESTTATYIHLDWASIKIRNIFSGRAQHSLRVHEPLVIGAIPMDEEVHGVGNVWWPDTGDIGGLTPVILFNLLF